MLFRSTTDGATVVIKEPIAPATTAYTATAISGKGVGFALEAHGDAANSKFLVNGAAVASGYTLSDGVNHFAIQVSSLDGSVQADYTLDITAVQEGSCTCTLETPQSVVSGYDGKEVKRIASAPHVFSGVESGEGYTYTDSRYG